MPWGVGRSVEWRTLILIILCYLGWVLAGLSWQSGFWYLGIVALPFLAAFHTSLQHETIHGHPTRFGWLNEALVSLPLAVVFPYRRYRDLHLQHHVDANLTDPYEDPESYYWPASRYRTMRPVMKTLFRFNNTLVGRLLIGPFLTIYGFGRTELMAVMRNQPGVRTAWALHGIGLLMLGAVIHFVFAMPLWVYLVFIVCPALSITSLRSYAEHQAAENIGGRTAVVETNAFCSLLYLNNNLHIVHHAHPSVPWYEIPAYYEERKKQYLAANGNLRFSGYGEIVQRFAFTTKQPVEHPFLYQEDRAME